MASQNNNFNNKYDDEEAPFPDMSIPKSRTSIEELKSNDYESNHIAGATKSSMYRRDDHPSKPIEVFSSRRSLMDSRMDSIEPIADEGPAMINRQSLGPGG